VLWEEPAYITPSPRKMPTDQKPSLPARTGILRRSLLAAMKLMTATAALSAQQADSLPQWMTVDSSGRAVTLELKVEATAGASATIAGHRQGGVQIVVPLGWTVRWHWSNADSTATHSLVVMSEREKLPAEGDRPAFDNAMSRSVLPGLAAGKTDETTFTADQVGWYWLLCGVPGHALGGEWIGLKVDADGKTPGVSYRQ
jgi:uncharacterized cupredoxin-like copper-binding protein